MADAAVWALEGELAGQPVRWSTAPMLGFDPILLELGSYEYGLGDTVGVIERLGVAITIANHGGDLDALAMGSSEDGVDWQGPSLQDLRCRLYRYTGPETRQAMTPPLVVSEVDVDVGTITLQLVGDEHPILGPSVAMATLEQWRQGDLELEWADPVAAAVLGVTDPELPGAFQSSIRPGNALQVPWLYGPVAVRLEAASEDAVWRIAGMVTPEHIASLKGSGEAHQRWTHYAGADGEPLLSQDQAYPVLLRHTRLPGVLLAWVCMAGSDVEIDWRWDHREVSPMDVVRQILLDHCPKPLPYHVFSAQRAARATERLTQVVGGAYADAATVEEVLSAIAPICGVEAYLDLDGILRFAPLPTPEELEAPVLELDPYDVLPDNTDYVPGATAELLAGPPAFGSVAGTISIDWPESRADAYPVHTGTDHRRVSEAEGEVRLEGAWIHPPRASVALSAAAEWYGYPIRIVKIPTHVDVVGQVHPGDVIAFRAPTLPGGERRLGIVRHIEILPGDEAVQVTVGDLGWEGMIRTGVLDSFENWIVFEPLAGTSVELTPGSASITLGVAAFTPADVGRRIWIRGSQFPENNRSYRIAHLVSSATVQLDPAPVWPDTWTELGQRSVLVMRAADHPDDPAVIGGKIAVSDSPVFSNDERAYRFAR